MFVIRHSKISNKAGNAICFQGINGVIEDVEIYATRGIALDCCMGWNDGDNLVIRRCQIRDGQSDGIQVKGWTGGIALEDSEILRNQGHGVWVRGGHARIRRCMINSNGGYGVYTYLTGADVTVENCEILINNRKGAYEKVARPWSEKLAKLVW